MQPRLDYWKAAPTLMKAVRALNAAVDESGLDKGLMHLVKLRASQINGCSYCVYMHSREARADGESEERVYLVSAWRESPLFSDAERAALAWTEKVTRLSEGPVDDAAYAEVMRHFSEQDVVNLTVLIGMINVWNRLCVPFHAIHPVAAASVAA
ncbi:carboxymuconolactone decarboxylase family protein [Aquamicrobium sp. LC103]|uniref:carboxymuconolactone decarboxylase family protein n=1 Tax=Aquamicrobium sp. LC103 TaxID=1120658 RepID=UPI00063EC801|nr:carboxymuconolactone decarboxylase family protein [Aquamicrobium sp. LC103]TKT80221.1 carboxymuconolactone decarboxylase family protein [Aquamicrobium sp. LC103]